MYEIARLFKHSVPQFDLCLVQLLKKYIFVYKLHYYILLPFSVCLPTYVTLEYHCIVNWVCQ